MEPDAFLMASVSPAQSGLPFAVYISEEQGSEPWVKVVSGEGRCAFVALSGRLVEGVLSIETLELVRRWIDANCDVIVGYWDRTIEATSEALAALKPLPPE